MEDVAIVNGNLVISVEIYWKVWIIREHDIMDQPWKVEWVWVNSKPLDCGHLGKQGEHLQISVGNIVRQLWIMANINGNMMGKVLHGLRTNIMGQIWEWFGMIWTWGTRDGKTLGYRNIMCLVAIHQWKQGGDPSKCPFPIRLRRPLNM